MRILTRYLLRAHLGPFLFALSVLTGLLLINVVARRFEELAGKGLTPGVIAEVFFLSIPHILALTLPMAVLVAVLHAFSTLTAENEIAALKASGVNIVRLLRPLLGAGIALAAFMVYFNDSILPETNHALKNLLVDIGRKSPTLELEEQMINEIQTGDMRTRYFLQAAQIEPATNRLRDVVIYDLSEPGRSRTVYADSGRMAFNEARTDLFLTLFDGWINEVEDRTPEEFQRMYFDKQLVRLAGVGNQLERSGETSYRSDREMSLAMLAEEIRSREQEAAAVRDSARRHAIRTVEMALAGRESGWSEPPPPLESSGRRIEMPIGIVDSAAAPAAPDDSARATDSTAIPLASLDRVRDSARAAAARGVRSKVIQRPGRPPLVIPQPPARTDTATAPAAAARGVYVQRDPAADELTRRTATELRSLENRASLLERRRDSYSVEYHKKFSIPFACIVFVLIGAPIAVRFPRGGIGMVIAASLSIFMIYYMGLIGGENLADEGMVSPFWAMWAPNLIFLGIGIWAVTRMGREMSTARGGGWDDLLFTAKNALAGPLRRLRGRTSKSDVAHETATPEPEPAESVA